MSVSEALSSAIDELAKSGGVPLMASADGYEAKIREISERLSVSPAEVDCAVEEYADGYSFLVHQLIGAHRLLSEAETALNQFDQDRARELMKAAGKILSVAGKPQANGSEAESNGEGAGR